MRALRLLSPFCLSLCLCAQLCGEAFRLVHTASRDCKKSKRAKERGEKKKSKGQKRDKGYAAHHFRLLLLRRLLWLRFSLLLRNLFLGGGLLRKRLHHAKQKRLVLVVAQLERHLEGHQRLVLTYGGKRRQEQKISKKTKVKTNLAGLNELAEWQSAVNKHTLREDDQFFLRVRFAVTVALLTVCLSMDVPRPS